ncbi:hypothetical protein CEXT_364921 [Caerostris extrusa]|uniref:Secreted protein n=1 Tax=Caerostris extrusa TaxID=172846 RepID=A0AAV4QVV3_CAEEX|nr:hypothetical protein CEXT_364921 [Caerostris extrusa]
MNLFAAVVLKAIFFLPDFYPAVLTSRVLGGLPLCGHFYSCGDERSAVHNQQTSFSEVGFEPPNTIVKPERSTVGNRGRLFFVAARGLFAQLSFNAQYLLLHTSSKPYFHLCFKHVVFGHNGCERPHELRGFVEALFLGVVMAGIVRLRYKQPNLERPIKGNLATKPHQSVNSRCRIVMLSSPQAEPGCGVSTYYNHLNK